MAEENKPTPASGDILDSIDNKIGKLDRIFDHFNTIWKKHWGKIIILVVGASIYFFMKWAMSLPDEPQAESAQTEEKVTVNPSATIVEKTYIIDSEGYREGDTIYVDKWSDGMIDKYYTNGEAYKE